VTAAVKEALWPTPRAAGWQVHAIVDAARDPRVLPAVRGSGLPHACLYAGRISPALASVAPYLVQLDEASPFTRELLEERWGASWGIYVLGTATLEELRRHFRRFLEVRTEAGKTLLFRFYDPRVMRAYLPTCNARELAYVFGPVAMYVMEGETGNLLRFHRGEAKLLETAETSLV
jgi:hypothetical protein